MDFISIAVVWICGGFSKIRVRIIRAPANNVVCGLESVQRQVLGLGFLLG